MSEQDEQRPLTRRERRLREMAETGALDLSEMSAATDGGSEPQPAEVADPGTGDIEISPFHEDGTPRSRREMRQLREAALAARAARSTPESSAAEAAEDEHLESSSEAADAPAPGETPAEPVATSPADAQPEPESGAPELADESPEAVPAPVRALIAEPAPFAEPAPVDEPAPVAGPAPVEEPAPVAEPMAAPAPQADEPDFDTLIAPPTEPFTVEELREAEQHGGEPAVDAGATDAPTAPEAETVAAVAEPEPAKPKRRFWQRSREEADRSAEAAAPAPAEAPEPVEVGEVPVDRVDDGADAGPAAETVVAEVVREEPAEAGPAPEEAEPETAVFTAPAGDEAADLPSAGPQEEPIAERADGGPEQKTSYSFPDIAPPEEWRSVFDDPSSRTVPDQLDRNDAGGDFDDLISRAVAQEGSTGGASTAALILPSMPEDTGGLTGPLGGTGELYVTGSLKLPKSLGETGGHSALHDSIEMDPITGAPAEDTGVTGEGPAPVSARHAVSARALSSMPAVAKPAKERSKLPLILSLTGGGVLIAVIALGAWGASNGVFG